MKEKYNVNETPFLDSSLFTALPAGDNAEILFFEYRKLVLLNMLGYLKSIQNALDIDISFIINKYEILDPRKKFSPALFELFSKLPIVAKQGAVPAIIDVLHRLNCLTEHDIFDAQCRVSTILTENWETEFVYKLRNEDIPSKSGSKILILPILTPNISTYSEMLSDLKDEIAAVDSGFNSEISAFVTRLKMFNGRALKASTSASVFGAIYLNTPPQDENAQAYFADHIIHETSHLCLDILLAFDRLILNDESEKFEAPIRIDPRPMFGIFHATFVLSRMIRLFQKIANNRTEYLDRLELFKAQFDKGIDTIEKHARLTENGERVKDSFAKVIKA
ncbi:MAG: hypothetical protein JWO03_3428 [Bacteroidetes bacterium]|nr:hypothetical protein [Bacteroidota bacterium]